MTVEQTVSTRSRIEAVDITDLCQSMLSSAKNGIAVYNVVHTTAALILCENDGDLLADLVKVAENWLSAMRPFKHGSYGNPNAEAHILSALAGASLTLPIIDGRLLLGDWQRVMLLELDGPRRRKLMCTVLETDSNKI